MPNGAPFLCPSLTGEQCSTVNESSSLLGGSPRRQCGRKGSPYHTGQLHPAVRVADLLQHINQMKTAEGYGFKQEYEGGSIGMVVADVCLVGIMVCCWKIMVCENISL